MSPTPEAQSGKPPGRHRNGAFRVVMVSGQTGEFEGVMGCSGRTVPLSRILPARLSSPYVCLCLKNPQSSALETEQWAARLTLNFM